MNHLTGIDLTVKIADISIAYDDLGTGKLPVLFIHGFPFDKSSWKPQMDVLSKTQRAIAYDIRGFGKSGLGTSSASISLFANDLINFMDTLKIDKAIVCGLSMGGYILLNAIYLYPDRFSAIILCDTQCIPDAADVKVSRIKTIELIQTGHKSEFAEGFIKKIFCSTTIDIKPEVVDAIRDTILNTSELTITGTLTALAERDEMCSMLNKIAIPALIICGESDVVTPLDQSRLMQSRIPNAAIRIIRNAGHLSNLEQPDDFNEEILRFISILTK